MITLNRFKVYTFDTPSNIACLLCRCGYHPDQYPSEREWGARLMMERSIAIKSPSIHYHLAGTKKVTSGGSDITRC